MAKKPKPEGKKYNYMDTYGDLVTLLLCFFVLLFSMSTVEENKFNAFAEALAAQFGTTVPELPAQGGGAGSQGTQTGTQEPTGDGVTNPDQTLPADFSKIVESIQNYVESNNMQNEVSVVQGSSGATFIRLSDNLLFDGNSSALRPDAKKFLDFLGASLLGVQDQIFQVRFLGHTAAIPGSSTDDWILSPERSGRVASYFERQVGFSPYLMQAVGYGRHFPIADNSTPAGMARNRRVDIVVIGNDPNTLAQALVEASKVYFPGDNLEFFKGLPEELPQNTLNNIPALSTMDLSHLSNEQKKALEEAIANVDSSQ